MWYKIIQVQEWFGESLERYKLIREFNNVAKYAFVNGSAPTLLQAKITKGESVYRHAFSKWMAGGFRIKALSGRALEKSELIEISKVVLDNKELIRKMITLGWDTLEIHSNTGFYGVKYSLKEHAEIGGYLS